MSKRGEGISTLNAGGLDAAYFPGAASSSQRPHSSDELFGRKSCRLHVGWGRTSAECGKQAGTPKPSCWPMAAPTLPRPSPTQPGRDRRLGMEIPASETGDAAGWAVHTGPRATAAAALATAPQSRAEQSRAGAPTCSSEPGREHAPGPRH